MGKNGIKMSIKLALILLGFFCSSCVSTKIQAQNDQTINIRDIIIHYIDVHNRSPFVPKAKFYHVSYRDTVYYFSSNNDGDWDAVIYDELSVVSFLGDDNPGFLDIDKQPNEYRMKGDVLYVWYNPNNGPNYELEQLLNDAGYIIHTDLLTESEIFELRFKVSTIPCNQKGTDIFFLRDKNTKHRIKVSSIAQGYYEPPRVSCHQKKKHKNDESLSWK